MAVTIETDDLVVPAGELSNHYFPQGDMATQLTGWLAAATDKVEADSSIDSDDHNEAAAAWIYYRAYTYIANQLAALPSQASEGDGAISVSYSASQIVHYRNLAAAHLAQFEALRSVSSSVTAFFTLARGQRGR